MVDFCFTAGGELKQLGGRGEGKAAQSCAGWVGAKDDDMREGRVLASSRDCVGLD